jgi:hypothetical protein
MRESVGQPMSEIDGNGLGEQFRHRSISARLEAERLS